MSDEAYRRAISSALKSFPSRTSALPPEQRVYFYELVAHQLTVAVRVIWASDRLTDAEKVEAMMLINEAMHKTLNHIRSPRNEPSLWTEDDMASQYQHYASMNKHVHGLIGQAVFYVLEQLGMAEDL